MATASVAASSSLGTSPSRHAAHLGKVSGMDETLPAQPADGPTTRGFPLDALARGLERALQPPPHLDMTKVSTNVDTLTVQMNQLGPTIARARQAAHELLTGPPEGDWQGAQARFLVFGGMCLDFLLSNSRQHKRRSRDLRHVLGVGETSFSWVRAMRHTYIHVDERIAEIFERDADASFTMWAEGPYDTSRTSLFGFDRDQGMLYSIDADGEPISGNIREFDDFLAKCSSSVGEVFFYFVSGKAAQQQIPD